MIVIVLVSVTVWLVDGLLSASSVFTHFTGVGFTGGGVTEVPWGVFGAAGLGGGVELGDGVSTREGTLLVSGAAWAIAGIVTVTVFGFAWATELLTIIECGIDAEVGTRGGGMLPSAGLCIIGRGICVTTTCWPCGVTATIFCVAFCGVAACGCKIIIVLVAVPCC